MKKRKKRSRLRGRRTCGFGSRKKHRGKGSRGGCGMAGTGKRAGQKITWLLKNMPNYLGKKELKSYRAKLKAINLGDINERLDSLMKKGFAKKTSEGIEINLKDYKILGNGNINEPLIIKATSFSKSAEEKIKAKGGQAIAENKKSE